MYSVVHNVAPIQPTLISVVLLELLIDIVDNGLIAK